MLGLSEKRNCVAVVVAVVVGVAVGVAVGGAVDAAVITNGSTFENVFNE